MSYSNPKIEAVFDGIESRILQELEKATFSIQIAMAWWTSKTLTQKVVEIAKEGIQVEIIVWDDNPFFIDLYPNNEALPRRLIDSGVTLLSYRAARNGKFHNKYCIIDDQVVITGSYNWTFSAENRNEENIVVIKDPKIVDSYLESFHKFLPKTNFYNTPKNLPIIKFFPTKKFVQKGEIVEIYWNIQNADEYEIDSVLESEDSTGKAVLEINAETLLTLVAKKEGQEIVKKLKVKLYIEPSIDLALYTKGFTSDSWIDAKSFTEIEAYHIFEGQPVKLVWVAENVDRLFVDGQEYNVSSGMTGIPSNASRTCIIEAFNRDRRIDKEINIYVTPVPKFDTFKAPIPSPIELKMDFTFENVSIPSTLELLDTPLLGKINFPKIKDLKVVFTSNKPTIIKTQPLISITESEDSEIIPAFDTKPLQSKTTYIKPSFRETWKKQLKVNQQIITHIKKLFKPNG